MAGEMTAGEDAQVRPRRRALWARRSSPLSQSESGVPNGHLGAPNWLCQLGCGRGGQTRWLCSRQKWRFIKVTLSNS